MKLREKKTSDFSKTVEPQLHQFLGPLQTSVAMDMDVTWAACSGFF